MTKATKKLLTQPSDWWQAFEAQAKREGMTLAEWVGFCCVANVPSEERQKLSERRERGRPKVTR